LNLAVGCHDFLTESRATPQSAAPAMLDIAEFERDEGACDALHAFRAGPQTPVVSDIPTLMFTGEFDVPTHRSYGSAAAASLRNSRIVEIPGAGHGASWVSSAGAPSRATSSPSRSRRSMLDV
jgi:pimeloyl-ACP methyl ester carboxylesterase